MHIVYLDIVLLYSSQTMGECERNECMHWETKTLIWLTLLWYRDGLEPNPQCFGGVPVCEMVQSITAKTVTAEGSFVRHADIPE